MGAYHNDGCSCDKCRKWRRSTPSQRMRIVKKYYVTGRVGTIRRRRPVKKRGWFW